MPHLIALFCHTQPPISSVMVCIGFSVCETVADPQLGGPRFQQHYNEPLGFLLSYVCPTSIYPGPKESVFYS